MALDTGNYISDFDRANPTATDPVSQGDDVLRFIKTVLQKTFPMGTDAAGTATGVGPNQAVQVIIAKSSAPSITGTAAESMGLVWLDTSNDLVKMRNQANDAWITLPFDPETNQKIISLAGTIDGTVIGGTTSAAITGTTIVADTSVNIAGDGATVTGIKDEDDMSSDSAVKLATQQSIKAYVDSQVTAQDLDITTDSGTIDIDLDSETLTVAGGSGLDTAASSTTVTVNVTDGGVTNAKLADMAANTVKVRDANSSGVPSDVALATTEILIGDGTGFTAAALSGDATMTNAGAVTVAKIQGEAVSATASENDQYLKYSSASSEWQKVDVVAPDRLTTKGDLLVYNTVDSETRLPVGTNNYSLLADSGATNGVAWKQIVDASVDASAGIDATKIADGSVTSTEFQYINSLSSNAQTQIDSKGATAGSSSIVTVGTVASGTWEATDVAILHGGTGASTDSAARTNLGVAIGSDVQAFDADTAKLDVDQSWSGSQRGTPSTVTNGTLDLDTANNFLYTPAAADVLEFSNETTGQSGFIKLINPSAYTISLGSEVKAVATFATDVSVAGTYLVSYFSDGTDVYVSSSAALV
jgi:hypothetical protein